MLPLFLKDIFKVSQEWKMLFQRQAEHRLSDPAWASHSQPYLPPHPGLSWAQNW
jgi:hypothetical protein